MTDFKDVLQQLRQDDRSITLQEFARQEMRRLLSKRSKSSDTIKRKRKCSALQKEVVTMGKRQMSKLSESLLPPSWRSDFLLQDYPATMEEAVEKILYLIDPHKRMTEKEKENDRINIRSILEDMDPKRIFLENPERVSFNEVDQAIARLRYEYLGDPLKFEVEGMDPGKLRSEERNEFFDDPELHEMETGICYEIKIRWSTKSLIKSLRNIMRHDELDLFLCVPRKFAGAALLVAANWSDHRHVNGDQSELILVSTGFCFESSKDIKIEESDKIYVFNGASSLFQSKRFFLQRRSDIDVYRTRKEGCP